MRIRRVQARRALCVLPRAPDRITRRSVGLLEWYGGAADCCVLKGADHLDILTPRECPGGYELVRYRSGLLKVAQKASLERGAFGAFGAPLREICIPSTASTV